MFVIGPPLGGAIKFSSARAAPSWRAAARSLALAASLLALAHCGDDDETGRTDVATDTGGDTADVSLLDLVPTTDAAETTGTTTDTAGDASGGGFLAPCLENADCNSGLCIDTDDGSVCTRDCTEACPDDWRCAGVVTDSADVRFVCVPLSNRLCRPCTVDHQCGGGFCLPDDTGAEVCTRPCDEGDDVPECPDGFTCEDLTSSEDPDRVGRQCVPNTGRCDCTAQNDGEIRPCPVENEIGRCWGVEVCDGAQGWSACDAPTPADEICDGLDQDCDGRADEGVAAPVEACVETNEAGTCEGLWTCTGPGGWVCDAPIPAAEVCDYRDEDCNGQVDDGFRDPETGLYIDDDNCGVCGSSCEGTIAFATATECAVVSGAAACIATSCEAGYFIPIQTQRACVPRGGGFSCSSCFGDDNCLDLPDGRCELLDGSYHCTRGCSVQEDCDQGFECDGGRCLPTSRSCSCLEDNGGNVRDCRNGNEAGICFGTQTCDPASGWSDCTAATPSEEQCNGLDDDCDQRVDEDAEHDPPTCVSDNDAGRCESPWVCMGAAGWQCEVDDPALESCNYRDDDCDGATDEGFLDADAGLYLNIEHCGACSISCLGALPNATEQCAVSTSGAARCEVASCDSGYFQDGPLACRPASADQCLPCESDVACGAGRCIALTDGSYCLNPCDTDDNCIEGYTCEDFDGGGSKLCVPPTRSCLCDGTNTSLFRGCTVDYTPPPDSGDAGYACFGTSQCTAQGWSACDVFAEECNLLDDDCDGATDEDFLVDGAFATDENCGQCGNNCTLLDFPGGGGVCNDFVSPPRCSLRCSDDCVDLNANPNDGCECCNPTPEDFPDPLGYDANCDGIDGERDNSIFVAKWGDDDNSGLWGSPKLTIGAGIAAAVDLGKRDVLVATGIYREAIDLAKDVGVYGGYASDYARRDPGLFETAMLGPDPTPTHPATVNVVGVVEGLPGRTVFDGFAVYGPDVKVAGGSSFAMRVVDSDASVRVSLNRVFAGSGGRGRRGTDGVDGDDAPDGGAGQDAFDVFAETGVTGHGCAAAGISSDGGVGATHTCGGTDTSGGMGGDRVCPAWDDGLNATVVPVASERGVAGQNGGAVGGLPGRDVFHQRFSCEGYDTFDRVEGGDGADGAQGDFGDAGEGCADADGVVLGGVWVTGQASAGGTGTHGGGGGGGGSGAGAYVHESCNAKGLHFDNVGGTGGGAGAGGGAGTEGGPGTSGGGAFGLLVAFSTPPVSLPEIRDNTIHGGLGGDGGDGGNAGVGGSGGAGAFGGAGGGDYNPAANPPIVDPTYPAFKGGKGGKGGNGGHGGGGGGGCGGPAYGIYVDGQGALDASAWATDNAFPTLGSGGSGGLGGFSLGEQGGPGAQGTSAATRL
ncbi:MAG: hypothetical protein IT385_23450 [Deltaproteobacteria bacterium]|nr:hypothetical protein [Deltaproteobacteria bacterium]